MNTHQFKEIIRTDLDVSEPQPKRRHIDKINKTDIKEIIEENDTLDEIVNNNVTTTADMWQSNYISVESFLPTNHTLLVKKLDLYSIKIKNFISKGNHV